MKQAGIDLLVICRLFFHAKNAVVLQYLVIFALGVAIFAIRDKERIVFLNWKEN